MITKIKNQALDPQNLEVGTVDKEIKNSPQNITDSRQGRNPADRHSDLTNFLLF